MDINLLITRSDAPVQAVSAFGSTFVNFSESRLNSVLFELGTSGIVWGGVQGAVVACLLALLRFPIAEKLKPWIVLVNTEVNSDTAD